MEHLWGVSIEIPIFDPFGGPTSWFAPRQFDLWTRQFGVNLGGFPQKSLSFNMAHLEVVETGIFYYGYAQIANKHLHSSRRELAIGTPDHTVNASSATEDAVSDEAAHRLVSMPTHPQPQRWVPCSRKCHR